MAAPAPVVQVQGQQGRQMARFALNRVATKPRVASGHRRRLRSGKRAAARMHAGAPSASAGVARGRLGSRRRLSWRRGQRRFPRCRCAPAVNNALGAVSSALSDQLLILPSVVQPGDAM
ncbi:hypothetical protein MRX96_030919 [Rhipicephalus microplus]